MRPNALVLGQPIYSTHTRVKRKKCRFSLRCAFERDFRAEEIRKRSRMNGIDIGKYRTH